MSLSSTTGRQRADADRSCRRAPFLSRAEATSPVVDRAPRADRFTPASNVASPRGSAWLLIAGVIAPFNFWIVVTTLSLVDPRHRPMQQAVSLLGSRKSGTYPLVMNALGFGLSGLLLTLFGVGLLRSARSRRGAAGSSLLILAAIAFAIAGIVTLPDTSHHLIAFTGLLLTLAGVCTYAGEHAVREKHRWLCFLSGIVALVAIACIAGLFILPGFAGLLQRFTIFVLLGWVEAVAITSMVTMDRPAPIAAS